MQMRMLKGVCVSSPVCGYIQSRILFRNTLSKCDTAEGHANALRFLTVPWPPLHTLTFGPHPHGCWDFQSLSQGCLGTASSAQICMR